MLSNVLAEVLIVHQEIMHKRITVTLFQLQNVNFEFTVRLYYVLMQVVNYMVPVLSSEEVFTENNANGYIISFIAWHEHSFVPH